MKKAERNAKNYGAMEREAAAIGKRLDEIKALKRVGDPMEAGKRTARVVNKAKKETPKTLATLSEAIKEYKEYGPYYSEDFKRNPKLRRLAENAMKNLFERHDFGMAIRANVLESVYYKGFLNTFETGTSGAYNGSTKTSGAIETDHVRLKAAHKMFFSKNSAMKHPGGKLYLGPQLERSDYEKYGYLIQKDKLAAINNRLEGYGNCRFKKEKVGKRTTWQLGDSLENINVAQPSPVTKPSAVSFDDMITYDEFAKMDLFGNPSLSIDDLLKNSTGFTGENNPYIELQYHGKLSMDDVESITFLKPPRDKAPVNENDDWISKDLADKLVAKGIEIFYMEGKELKQYKK